MRKVWLPSLRSAITYHWVCSAPIRPLPLSTISWRTTSPLIVAIASKLAVPPAGRVTLLTEVEAEMPLSCRSRLLATRKR